MIVCWCLTSALLLAAGAPPRVVVLGEEATRALSERLSLELRTLGFDVIEAQAPGEAPTRDALDDAASRADAIAALRLRPSRQGVEVWVADRLTQKLVLRELVTGPGDDPRDRVLALRSVELLRASLLELASPPPSVPTPPPPAPVAALLAPSTPAAWSVTIGPSLWAAPGGAPLHVQVFVSARVRLLERFGLGLSGAIPTLPGVVRAEAGTASLSPSSLAAGVWFEPTDAASKVTCQLGLETGASWTRLVDAGAAGFRGLTRDEFTSLTSLTVFAAARVMRGFLVGVEARAGVSAPSLVIRVGEEAAARLGPFVASAALVVGVER